MDPVPPPIRPQLVVRLGLDARPAGGRVAILHIEPLRPPKRARFVASIAVLVGFDNVVRVFSVYEKPSRD